MNHPPLPTIPTINPSIHQSINPSIHQSINPSIHQSINPSIHQSINPRLDSIPCLGDTQIRLGSDTLDHT